MRPSPLNLIRSSAKTFSDAVGMQGQMVFSTLWVYGFTLPNFAQVSHFQGSLKTLNGFFLLNGFSHTYHTCHTCPVMIVLRPRMERLRR